MSYVLNPSGGGGGGDTYTLKAAQDGSDVDIQLDAASGTDSEVKLKAGTNITLTEASDTVTIDSAGAGGSIGVNQVAFGDPLNAGDIKGSNNFQFVDESGGTGPTITNQGDKPRLRMVDDTDPTDYETLFFQSGASGHFYHEDSTGVSRPLMRLASSTVIFNEGANDVDVRIEGTGNQNLLKTNAGNDEVGIGIDPTSGQGILQVGGALQVNDKAKIGNATIQEDTQMKLHVVGSDANLCIEDQDDGSSSGPAVRFSRISASPAASDVLGQMVFRGNQTGGSGVVSYGSVRQEIVDPASGTKTGRMVFKTINSNTQSDKMQIDSQITSLVNHNFQGLIKVNNQAGTSGQVLTSQGPSSDPIWAAGGGGGSSLNQALNPVELIYSVAPSVIDTYLLSRTVGMTCVGSLSNSYLTRSGYSQPRFRSFIAPKTGNVDQFLVSVATANASTNFLVGIYSHTDGLPTALMGRAEMDCSSTGEVAQNNIVDASGSSATISLTQGQMYFYAWNRTNTAGNPRLHAENPAGSQWVISQVQTMTGTDNSYNMLDVSTASSNTLPATPTANQIYLGGNTSLPLRLGIKYS